jgi:predicted ribosome quality control (RQC) complex YloA/Tae2 family protein
LAEKLSQQLTKKDKAQKYKNYADLIMSNLYNNKDFSKEITVPDWSGVNEGVNEGVNIGVNDEDRIVIPLDEKLTLKENAQKYYQLYTKSKSAVEKLKELKIQAQETADYIESILYSITCAETFAELSEILSECEEAGYTGKNIGEHQKDKKIINIEEVIINGFKVYIGKNNKQNDYIVSKLSAPNDIWFHTQNCTGSHILLKVVDNREPDEATVYECAKLAKRYSSASENTKAGVIYTKRKFLKKPPKSNLGYVTYKNEKEIMVS